MAWFQLWPYDMKNTGKPYRVPERIFQETASSGLFCLDLRLVALLLQNFKRFYWNATWLDSQGNRHTLTQEQRDLIAKWENDLMSQVTIDIDLSDITNAINNQTTLIVNAINGIDLPTLEELEGIMSQTQNQYVTVNACGCGGSTVITDPPNDDNQNDDLTSPDITSDPIPTSDTYKSALCLRAKKMVLEHGQLFIDLKTGLTDLDDETALINIISSIPFFSPFTSGIALVLNALSLFEDVVPFDDIISVMQDTVEERTCIVYSSTSAQTAFDSYNALLSTRLKQQLGNLVGFVVHKLVASTMMLIDWGDLYNAESDTDTSGVTGDCASCGSGDPASTPSQVGEATLNANGFCMTPAILQPTFTGGATITGLTDNSISLEFPSAGLVPVIFPRPDLENIVGIAMRSSNISGSVPLIGGFGATVHIASLTTEAGGVTVFCTPELATILSGSTANVVESFSTDETAEFFYIQTANQASITLSEWYWIHDCPEPSPCSNLYLTVTPSYTLEPDCWTIGNTGQSFYISNNIRSDGTDLTNDVPEDIESGINTTNNEIKFNGWQPIAQSAITLSAYRKPSFDDASNNLWIRIVEAGTQTLVSEHELQMPSNMFVYTITTPLIDVGNYDVYILSKDGNGNDTFSKKLVIFDIAST